MFVMHFYFVCNMYKIGRIFVIYILVLTTTGADELKSKYKTSTTTAKWKEPTTTTKWKEPTSTSRWKEPESPNKWREPASTSKWKQYTTTTKWTQPTTTKATPTTRRPTQYPANHGVVAVASFSGMDSRNGRLSSMNGIKIFPPVDSSMINTDNKGNFIFKSVNGKVPMPITITKQGDGVSGTIRIQPGSVSVSSSASSPSKSGPATAVASYNPWPTPYMKPIMNDIYFPPFPTFPSLPEPVFNNRIPDTSFHSMIQDPFTFMRIPEPTFHSRIQDPWFDKDSFKQHQPKHDMFKSWFYPSFNPFINYW